jgi:hypothetical protein
MLVNDITSFISHFNHFLISRIKINKLKISQQQIGVEIISC